MPDSTESPLRDDIHLLGDLLGETLRAQEGVALFELVERVRALAKRARGSEGAEAGRSSFEELASLLSTLSTETALPTARAFAHFLSLANIAEQHHRVRRRRQYQREADAPPQAGSCDEVFGRLIGLGVSTDRLFQAVSSLRIELVLTAHPTEVARRTLLQNQRRIAGLLAQRDALDLTVSERRAIVDELRREVTTAWETDEVRHQRPTPLDEVKGGLFVFEQTLFHALPQVLRALDDALVTHTGRMLPLDAAPIRFGSWIGGDRDGNPNVTAEVTRKACLLSRWMAADLYLVEIDELRSELSMARGSSELEQFAGCRHEPYREVLKKVRERLLQTRVWLERELEAERPASEDAGMKAGDLHDALLACWRSLHATGNELIARGRLLDVLRRVNCLGLTLVRLDIRQDSARHRSLVEALDRGASLDEEQQADLDTFHAIDTIDPQSLGAYVITMAGSPEDVLNVARLQNRMRIVPLFETIEDLRSAGQTVRALLANEEYRATIDGRQEVMIGYSDSSKEAGRFTAAWELYKAQEQIVAACAEAGVELTLFHGRGGSVGRGGGPTYLAISSQPPGSVDGRLRVTVQGEMIQAEFGLAGIALRTLEIYTTATLEATLVPAREPRPEWRTLMDRMSGAASRGYRDLIYESPAFLDYFRAATPEVELGEMNIGSRPARRGASRGVESLRAILWQFAWTQNRLLVPSWLGADDALRAAPAASLAEMMREWPFFRSTIELIEMVLAKVEAPIAAYYDRLLVPESLRAIGADLQVRLAQTVDGVRGVTGHQRLLENNPVLRRSIDVRNPYVDPINLVQAEILRRLRAERNEELRDAFVVTVNGIAAGMRNTG